MSSLGPWELAIILLIVVVVFGAGKLPEVGSALGKSIREFKRATAEEADTDESGPARSTTTATGNVAATSRDTDETVR